LELAKAERYYLAGGKAAMDAYLSLKAAAGGGEVMVNAQNIEDMLKSIDELIEGIDLVNSNLPNTNANLTANWRGNAGVEFKEISGYVVIELFNRAESVKQLRGKLAKAQADFTELDEKLSGGMDLSF
jgi:uncharacterized protein YukE